MVQPEAATVTEVDEGGEERRGGGGRGERGGEGRMDWKCASSGIYKYGPFTHLRVIVYIYSYMSFVPVCFSLAEQ